MPLAAHHADALRLEVSSVEIQQFATVHTIPGVVILLVAARNGPGQGRIRSTGDGTLLSWRAPDSSTFGTPLDCSADGTYVLEDGEDPDKYIRIQVYADYLTPGPIESRVYLDDLYDNGAVDDDVTAEEAAAGDVATYTITLENASGYILSGIVVWLAYPSEDLEISDDGAAWVSPTDEESGLAFPDLPVGGTDVLHLRRTIAAGASSESSVLNLFHIGFDGL